MENLKKTIVLKVTKNCNLKCKYCYERKRKVPLLANKDIEPSKIINFINSHSKNCDFLFLLHGGEPLLIGKKEYENIIIELENAKKNNNIFGIAIQTNATLIDDDWISLFDKSIDYLGERQIGISIDGPKYLNDSMRVDNKNLGSFDVVDKSLDLLFKHNFNYGLSIVVGKHNYKNAKEIYDFLKNKKPLLVKFLPIYDIDDTGNLMEFSINPIVFSDFLIEIYDYWLSDYKSTIILEPFISILSNLSQSFTNWCEYSSAKCDNFLVIENNGLIGACDNWENKNQYFNNKPIFDLTKEELSDIFTFKTDSYKIIDDRINVLTADCKKCNYFEYCRGGCMATRHFFYNSNKKLYVDYCIAKKRIIDNILISYKQLIKQRNNNL